MNVTQLLAVLRSKGAVLSTDGFYLNVTHKHVLNDELRELIRAHKSDLLSLVAANAQTPCCSREVLGERIESQFRISMTPIDKAKYDRVVADLDAGTDPISQVTQENHL